MTIKDLQPIEALSSSIAQYTLVNSEVSHFTTEVALAYIRRRIAYLFLFLLFFIIFTIA